MIFKDLARHLTGLSVPWFGLQWTPPPDQTRIARKVLDTVANRRLFYAPDHVENEHACLGSANDLRDHLKQHMDESPPGSIVYQQTKNLQKAARLFVTELEALAHSTVPVPHAIKASRFYNSLHHFRRTAGVCVASLAAAYGLDIDDELAAMVPFDK